LLKHAAEHGSCRTAVSMAIEVYGIVQVAGTRALAQGAELFAEGLFVGVAIGPESVFRTVCVGVEHFAADRGQHQSFVGREVELNLRPASGGWRNRPAISDLRLTTEATARILVNIETKLVGRNIQSGLFGNPGADVLERLTKKFLVDVAFVAQGEVEILRKSVGLEIALLEARTALENPTLRNVFVRVDTGEYPAEHVVLFDHAGQQGKR